MRRAILAAIATLLVAVPSTHAQTNLPPNSRVRVELRDGHHVIGRLTDAATDTLVVIDDGLVWDSKHRIPADRVTRIDVSRGKYVHGGRVIGGALLGAVGAVGVVALVPGLAKQCSADVCDESSGLVAALLVGITGGVTLGMLTPADHWEAVPTPVRVGLGTDGRRARLGVSFAF